MAKMRYTETGPRPDLRAASKGSQADLGGYGFPKLFPCVIVTEKGGTTSFAPMNLTNAAGVEDRADGASLSSDSIAMVDVDWSVKRFEGRVEMYASEVGQLPDIETADAMGGLRCVRKTLNKIEQSAAATVFSAARRSAAVTLSNGKVIQKLQAAAKKQRGYGKPYLVVSSESLLTLAQLPEIRAYAQGPAAAQSLGNLILTGGETLLKALSPVIGFAGIVVFDTDIVGTTYDTFVAVVSLRAEAIANPAQAIMIGKESAMYGVTMVYVPDDAADESIVDVTTSGDTILKRNIYDGETFAKIVEVHGSDLAETPDVNAGAVTVFKYLADLSSYTPVEWASIQSVRIVNDAGTPVLVSGEVTIANADPIEISGSVNSTVTPAAGAVFTTATATP